MPEPSSVHTNGPGFTKAQEGMLNGAISAAFAEDHMPGGLAELEQYLVEAGVPERLLAPEYSKAILNIMRSEPGMPIEPEPGPGSPHDHSISLDEELSNANDFMVYVYRPSPRGSTLASARMCQQKMNFITQSVARRIGPSTQTPAKNSTMKLDYMVEKEGVDRKTRRSTFVVVSDDALPGDMALGPDFLRAEEDDQDDVPFTPPAQDQPSGIDGWLHQQGRQSVMQISEYTQESASTLQMLETVNMAHASTMNTILQIDNNRTNRSVISPRQYPLLQGLSPPPGPSPLMRTSPPAVPPPFSPQQNYRQGRRYPP
ncbi:hypothetical protein F4780DRAFT_142228 [Xylariomycetidae sp. FL0641]|nr:hypothetical protein F4780DRAFT_142228 [Xylariomycetidae sp. FL0641]